jgi:hypothetical protein
MGPAERASSRSYRPAPALPSDAPPEPLEAHLARQRRRPLAVAGVVENGLGRPLDPNVKLTESSRVIIVAAEAP